MKFKHLTLDALVASDLNVRKSQDDAQRFNELTASIAHYGVQTPLHIIAGENGIYEVVAGGRRLRALQALAKDSVIDSATYQVPCMEIDKSHAQEVSLVENMIRVNMHPAAEYRAFAELFRNGKTNTEIAKIFGMSARVVKQRLALGNLHPDVLIAYENGDIDGACAKAFTMVKSQQQQLEILCEHDGKPHGDHVRYYITKTSDEVCIKGDHKVTFIGYQAYLDAGGQVIENLFDDNKTLLVDGHIVQKLIADRHQHIIDMLKLRFEFVDIQQGHPNTSNYNSIYPTDADNLDIPAMFLDVFQELCKKYDSGNLSYWERQYFNMIRACSQVYDKPCGAIVCIGPYDPTEVTVQGGMIAKTKPGTDDISVHMPTSAPPVNLNLSEKLKQDLDWWQQQIIQGTASVHPMLAFDILVFEKVDTMLAAGHYTPRYTGVDFDHRATRLDVGSDITVSPKWDNDIASFPANLNTSWYIEGDIATSMDNLQSVPLQDKVAIIGYFVGRVVQPYAPAQYLCHQVGVGVRSWWQPTYDNYFKRLPMGVLQNLASDIIGAEWVQQNPGIKKKDIAETLAGVCKGLGDFPADVLERGKAFVPEQMRLQPLQKPDTDPLEPIDQHGVDESDTDGKAVQKPVEKNPIASVDTLADLNALPNVEVVVASVIPEKPTENTNADTQALPAFLTGTA